MLTECDVGELDDAEFQLTEQEQAVEAQLNQGPAPRVPRFLVGCWRVGPMTQDEFAAPEQLAEERQARVKDQEAFRRSVEVLSEKPAAGDPGEGEFRWSEPKSMREWYEIFGQHERTLRRWFQSGKIRARKAGRYWRVADYELP